MILQLHFIGDRTFVLYTEQLPQTGMIPWTFLTLFGLIAATKMELGEALDIMRLPDTMRQESPGWR